MTRPPKAHGAAWLAFALIDLVITAVVIVVFGLFGGFILMVALNGFSSRDAEPIFIGYYVVLLVGNALVNILANLLMRRIWPLTAALPSWAAYVTALAVTVMLMVVGPLLLYAVAFLRSSR